MNAYMPASELPPPKRLPPSADPLRPEFTSDSPQGSRVPAIVVLSIAAAGWLFLLFGLLAESDTGRPDGTGCTALFGDSYQSCMRDSEIGGLAFWAVTLGIGAAGLTVLLRRRRAARRVARAWMLTVPALLASTSLTLASITLWVFGARGRFYDDLVGSTAWNIAMASGLLAGVMIGLVFTRRRS